VAGLIGVGASIGLVLPVLIMLALRATSGSADIGIGGHRDRQSPRARPPEWIHSWPCATSDFAMALTTTTRPRRFYEASHWHVGLAKGPRLDVDM
jgi:hypothetical protein